jgi:alkylhydroperoxidase family enzyme
LALLAYAEKLTREPSAITDTDIDSLRRLGFDDAQLWEATFTASIFNLFPRMADAFGILPRRKWQQGNAQSGASSEKPSIP